MQALQQKRLSACPKGRQTDCSAVRSLNFSSIFFFTFCLLLQQYSLLYYSRIGHRPISALYEFVRAGMAGQIRQGKRSYENMKKMLSAALALAVALGLLAGCSGAPASSAASVSGAPAVSSSAAAGSAAPGESTGTPAAERTAFRIASLKGPTTMGLVKLMDEADKGEARHDYEVTMYGAADEIARSL